MLIDYILMCFLAKCDRILTATKKPIGKNGVLSSQPVEEGLFSFHRVRGEEADGTVILVQNGNSALNQSNGTITFTEILVDDKQQRLGYGQDVSMDDNDIKQFGLERTRLSNGREMLKVYKMGDFKCIVWGDAGLELGECGDDKSIFYVEELPESGKTVNDKVSSPGAEKSKDTKSSTAPAAVKSDRESSETSQPVNEKNEIEGSSKGIAKISSIQKDSEMFKEVKVLLNEIVNSIKKAETKEIAKPRPQMRAYKAQFVPKRFQKKLSRQEKWRVNKKLRNLESQNRNV